MTFSKRIDKARDAFARGMRGHLRQSTTLIKWSRRSFWPKRNTVTCLPNKVIRSDPCNRCLLYIDGVVGCSSIWTGCGEGSGDTPQRIPERSGNVVDGWSTSLALRNDPWIFIPTTVRMPSPTQSPR